MSNKKTPKGELTPRQTRFVKEVATGKTSATQAVLEAGYKATSRESASAMATTLMANPKIRTALQAEIDQAYPDLAKKSADLVNGWIDDKELKPEFKLKALQFLAEIMEWKPIAKKASINWTIKDRFKLPKE